MGQATLDDEDLFGEAADELQRDVRSHIADGWDALPAPDAIWMANADNVIGVLNTLRSNLDVSDAREHLREARKWHTVAVRAEAVDDDTVGEELTELEEMIDTIETIREQVSGVTSELPALREQLQSMQAPEEDPEQAAIEA